MSENKNYEQKHYDTLIYLSDSAFENSKQNTYTQEHWYAKSEAYEYAATLFNGNCFLRGVIIKSKKTKRLKEIEETKNEKMREDLKYEPVKD